MSFEQSSSFSSSTVQVAGQPTWTEQKSEYSDSTGKAHVKHVRVVGDKKMTKTWVKEAGKPAADNKQLENATEEEFEQHWAQRASGGGGGGGAIEDKE